MRAPEDMIKYSRLHRNIYYLDTKNGNFYDVEARLSGEYGIIGFTLGCIWI